MNVLSLFDGMSCGQIALERAGIPVENYYASEIDKYAIEVTRTNYPNTIQLGDICNIKCDDLPKIDLLIGGSPCQGFSFAGKMLNFEDPRSKLFFEFVRLLKECNPKYFLLENVKMKKEYQDVISKHLECDPVEINSSLLSAQNRKRLYWSNFKIEQPDDKGILLRDIVECDNELQAARIVGRRIKNGKRVDSDKSIPIIQIIEINRNPNKTGCLSTVQKDNVLVPKITMNEDIKNLLYRKLSPIECERLQTVPDNYTNHVSNSQRYKMLGNGWTVDVISHILKGIKWKLIKNG